MQYINYYVTSKHDLDISKKMMFIFEKMLYEEFLDIKTQYNHFENLEANSEVLQLLNQRIKSFCSKFANRHLYAMSPDFKSLFDSLEIIVDKYIK